MFYLICVCGEMDITMVYGTIISGSNPDRRTKLNSVEPIVLTEFYYTCYYKDK